MDVTMIGHHSFDLCLESCLNFGIWFEDVR